jgi:cytochrome c2
VKGNSIFLNDFFSLFSKVRLTTFFSLILFFSSTFFVDLISQEPDIQKGKSLFNSQCAACHKLNRKLVGPALKGVSAKYEK